MRYAIFLFALILAGSIFAQQQTQQAPGNVQQPSQSTNQQQPGQSADQAQQAQSAPAAGEAAAANTPAWLVGNWQGEGTEQGNTFSSQLSVDAQLDGEVILLRRSSSGGYKDVMIFGTEKGTGKLIGTVYDNKNHIGIYSCDNGSQQIVCSQVATQGGFTSKLTFQLVDQTKLHVTVESGKSSEALTKTSDLSYQKS